MIISVLAAALAASGAQTRPSPPPAAPPMQKASPDTPQVAAAIRLLDMTGFDATLDMIYIQLSPVFAQSVIGALSGDPETRGTLTAIQARDNGQERLVAILSQEFMVAMKRQYPALKRAAAENYAAAFTLAELEEMIAYYRSPTGAKALRLMPELQRKLGPAAQQLGMSAGMDAGRRAFERASREILEVETRSVS